MLARTQRDLYPLIRHRGLGQDFGLPPAGGGHDDAPGERSGQYRRQLRGGDGQAAGPIGAVVEQQFVIGHQGFGTAVPGAALLDREQIHEVGIRAQFQHHGGGFAAQVLQYHRLAHTVGDQPFPDHQQAGIGCPRTWRTAQDEPGGECLRTQHRQRLETLTVDP